MRLFSGRWTHKHVGRNFLFQIRALDQIMKLAKNHFQKQNPKAVVKKPPPDPEVVRVAETWTPDKNMKWYVLEAFG